MEDLEQHRQQIKQEAALAAARGSWAGSSTAAPTAAPTSTLSKFSSKQDKGSVLMWVLGCAGAKMSALFFMLRENRGSTAAG